MDFLGSGMDYLGSGMDFLGLGMDYQVSWTVLELAIVFVITYQSDIILLSLLVVIISYSTQAIDNVEYGGSLVTTVHHTTPYIVDTTAPLLQIIMVDPYDTVANTLTVHYMAR